LTSAVVLFFGLYWSLWITTLWAPPSHGTGVEWHLWLQHAVARDRLLIGLFLLIVTTLFVPLVAFALARIWCDRRLCGTWLSLLRAAPVIGMGGLYVRVARFALLFVHGLVVQHNMM
jgi:hypothetical protein